MKKPKDTDTICKHCKRLRAEHEDWVATGEFAANVVCLNGELDENGRYAKFPTLFSPMDNLEYLEYLDGRQNSR
jgi:hypothetical protein